MDAPSCTSSTSLHLEPSGEVGNEVRALAASEIDSVSGGSLLHAIGGLAVMAYVIFAWGKDIDAAFAELEEWIKS